MAFVTPRADAQPISAMNERRSLAATLLQTGMLDPLRLAAGGSAAVWWGTSPAMLFDTSALRHPLRTAVIDDHGSITYAELKIRTDHLATALRRRGVGNATKVGVLCANHRGFVEAAVGAAKAGATVVYLNTAFSDQQLSEVVAREQVELVLRDPDLAHPCRAGSTTAVETIDVVANGQPWSFPGVDRPRVGFLPPATSTPPPVLLTSGTTGTPKGAGRSNKAVDRRAATGLLQAIPYRTGDTVLIAPPVFHAWGMGQLLITAGLSGTSVLTRRFSPDAVFGLVRQHQPDVLAVVPTMLSRLLEAATPQDRRAISTHVRITASSGSALPASLALAWMDAMGDSIHNVYGSTEVGQATVAGPDDLRDAPGTAGRPIDGVEVVVLDESDAEAPTGTTGRIFVGGGNHFDGYTGGGSKAMVGSFMSIGDVGHFDADGRLFITGRDDDMIITGGENVFPFEIEEVLAAHPGVSEAAIAGVPDPDLGQRLEAWIVRAPGTRVRASTLQSLVEKQLARYKSPRAVHFVTELPRNPTGKLLRSALETHG